MVRRQRQWGQEEVMAASWRKQFWLGYGSRVEEGPEV